jgi:predicted transcriptional regulator
MNKLGPAFEMPILILIQFSKGAESRRKILLSLLSGPKNCSEIARDVNLDWWTVQKHLRSLLKENLVKESVFGSSTFYKLSQLGQEIANTLLLNNRNKDLKN